MLNLGPPLRPTELVVLGPGPRNLCLHIALGDPNVCPSLRSTARVWTQVLSCVGTQ